MGLKPLTLKHQSSSLAKPFQRWSQAPKRKERFAAALPSNPKPKTTFGLLGFEGFSVAQGFLRLLRPF